MDIFSCESELAVLKLILNADIDYENTKKDPADGLPDEKVDAIDELPVYSLNKPR
jgi:hypothetical protein